VSEFIVSAEIYPVRTLTIIGQKDVARGDHAGDVEETHARRIVP